MQNAALAELGLAPAWTYEAIEVAPAEFAALVGSLPARGFAGVNVTVPHKLAALALADTASAAASEIGAANTLSFRDGAVHADNTDAAGLIGALPEPPSGRRALVLGAGGSARAVVWALREAGADVSVWNRTQHRRPRPRRRARRERGRVGRPSSTCSSTARRSAWGIAPMRKGCYHSSRGFRSMPMALRQDTSWWTWSTETGRHHFCGPRRTKEHES